MIHGANTITKEKKYSFLFSICCIVTNSNEYELMKQSFVSNGFGNDIEFLIADNTSGNVFDAYTAINRFLEDAKGRFIIIAHQDIRCIDTAEVLIGQLNLLEQKDPAWAVCGNAGANGYKNLFYYLNNNGKIKKSDKLPVLVTSLDENLLIIKNGTNLAVSSNIKDFHFYGTDICIVANFLGFNCYVIPFMVHHLSLGNLQWLSRQQPVFVKKYGEKLKSRFVQTTCTKFYLSNSPLKNKIYNNAFVFFWIKAFNRMGNIFR